MTFIVFPGVHNFIFCFDFNLQKKKTIENCMRNVHFMQRKHLTRKLTPSESNPASIRISYNCFELIRGFEEIFPKISCTLQHFSWNSTKVSRNSRHFRHIFSCSPWCCNRIQSNFVSRIELNNLVFGKEKTYDDIEMFVNCTYDFDWRFKLDLFCVNIRTKRTPCFPIHYHFGPVSNIRFNKMKLNIE